MSDGDRAVDKLLLSLQERAKELNCLYEVEQALNRLDAPLDEAFQAVVDAIPPGWQYPDVCRATIEIGDRTWRSDEFVPTDWVQTADVVVQDEVVGRVTVCYVEERPRETIGPFLKEEERLIRTIAERLGHAILYQRLHAMRQEWEDTSRRVHDDKRGTWRGPTDLLRRTDRELYLRIARKMVNHLCWAGVDGAQELLLDTFGSPPGAAPHDAETNAPGPTRGVDESPLLRGAPFEMAASHLSDDEILALIRDWIMEDRASFLPKVLNSPRATLADIAEALRRFHHLLADGAELSSSTMNGLRVSLIRRFLTEQLDYITIAKQYIETFDFIDLLDRVVLSASSHGRLGGKSSGLFLAEKILRTRATPDGPAGEVRVPRSWYIASEGLLQFIEYNDLEEVLQQKYRDIAEVRHEYPNIVQLFKNSRFPPDFVRSLSILLDEAGDTPLIVRSSSLLEDRLGTAFSGKYKSLFLANQGHKQDRLAALLDAVTEVYASVFGPDPIAYRREKGLLDFHEEMAILVQQVVGTRVGDYFLPAFAGVAFSNNEFRWAPRIRREDGLIRLVPGLGTRAVDRTCDDYPVLVVPGQPQLRVNTTIDEVARYSPSQVDVLNLRKNRFETVPLRDLLTSCGTGLPAFHDVYSVVRDGALHRPLKLLARPAEDEMVADFGGLLAASGFVTKIGAILRTLQEALGTPVDIEFAHDGRHFYLLQCRPQSSADDDTPAPIPRDIPRQDRIFAARRHVSNGWMPAISHIVYVDPEAYRRLPDRAAYLAVGRTVGALNKLLPKRQFILMGPGRWGSRGDVRLGVPVTYSEINNAAMLIEIARREGSYLPDLSFGTHFFQDLVESRIRYLPLYPDEDHGELNTRFLLGAPNLLAEMVPEHAAVADVLRVIDVPASAGGRVLRVLLNADLDEALALLADPDDTRRDSAAAPAEPGPPRRSEEYWRWRMRMAERIAAGIDPERFGVTALYVIGSTKNATAGPASDIDLLVHVHGDDPQRRALACFLDGWSQALGEVNYLRTGYARRALLDVHIVTDADIAAGTSYAAKIGAVTDPARELPLGRTGLEPDA